MMSHESEQQVIIDWFNQVYRRKGERYLRPVRAYSIFLTLLEARPNQALLDVACGLGRLLEAAQAFHCDLHGIDVSDEAVKRAKVKLPDANILLANAEALPYSDSTFELVTCLGSLERIVNLHGALDELLRVGKEDARYCFLVRNANTFAWKWLKQALGMRNKKGHQGAKTLTDWSDVFIQCGFKISAVYPDQYPLQKRKKWLSLGLASVDPNLLLSSRQSLEHANEFLFILEKASKDDQ